MGSYIIISKKKISINIGGKHLERVLPTFSEELSLELEVEELLCSLHSDLLCVQIFVPKLFLY